jgi:alpha-1,6-mannosyltransferase
MKIVDVAEFYAEQGGGVRTYINQKLAAGRAAGHEVVVVAPGPKDAEEHRLGGRVIWIKGPAMPLDPRYFILYRQRAVHAVLDREQPDVVEGSSPWSGGWFVANWPGDAIKAFVYHQDPVAVYPETYLDGWMARRRVNQLFGWYWAYLRRLSAHFDTTVVSGEWLAEKLRSQGLTRPEAVPFGVDPAAFSPTKRDEGVRRRWLEACGLGPEAALLVVMSRFHPEKRLKTVFEGFRRARREQPMGLVVFGDGPQRGSLARRAARTPGIHIAGFVEDRERLAASLASADLFVHGSAAETYGLVVAEAICSGLPLVVPNVGGAADLADPSYAEVYAPGDEAGCAEAILRVLARPRGRLRRGCDAAASTKIGTAADHFTRLFELYASLLPADAPSRRA